MVYSHPGVPRLSPTMFRTEREQLHSHRCSEDPELKTPPGPPELLGRDPRWPLHCRVPGRASAASDWGGGGRGADSDLE